MQSNNQFKPGVPHFPRIPHACPERSRRVSPPLPEVGSLRILGVVLLSTLLLLGASDDARVDRLGRQVICMCGCNQILLECNHLGCPYLSRMKQELTSAVGRGDSDSAITQFFVQTYGTLVLAAPPNRGFNRIAWVMPYFALVSGITLVVFIVWMWRKRPVRIHASVPTPVRGEELSRFREQARKETAL
jgi:cytochrome c-type biogenesis protein CcmH/NrfF